MAIKWASQAEYAAHRGVSQQAVSKAIQTGRISEALGLDRKIKVAVADALWGSNTHPIRGGNRGSKVITPKVITSQDTQASKRRRLAGEVQAAARQLEKLGEAPDAELAGVPPLSVSRRQLEALKVRLATLELGQREGTLIERELADRQSFKLARTTRDALLSIPDRIAPELAVLTDPFAVHTALTQEIVGALLELIKLADLEPNELIEDAKIP